MRKIRNKNHSNKEAWYGLEKQNEVYVKHVRENKHQFEIVKILSYFR